MRLIRTKVLRDDIAFIRWWNYYIMEKSHLYMLVACGRGRQWPQGPQWCEPADLWLPRLPRWSPGGRQGQRARCGLAVALSKHVCVNEHTCTNINNDTDRNPTYTHARVSLRLRPRINYSASPRTPSLLFLLLLLFPLHLSLLCLCSPHQSLVLSC